MFFFPPPAASADCLAPALLQWKRWSPSPTLNTTRQAAWSRGVAPSPSSPLKSPRPLTSWMKSEYRIEPKQVWRLRISDFCNVFPKRFYSWSDSCWLWHLQERPVQLSVKEGAEESPVQTGESPHAKGGWKSHRARLEPSQQIQGGNLNRIEIL